VGTKQITFSSLKIKHIVALIVCMLGQWNYIVAYEGVRKLSVFIKNILICVLKMNRSLAGLEQHEGE